LFSSPLIDLLPSVGASVEELALPFFSDTLIHANLFGDIRERLERNQHEASNVPFTLHNRQSPKLIMPSKSPSPRSELVADYLHGTPFTQLFSVHIPFEIPQETRFSGMWVCAPQGRGKTTLLKTLFAHDFKQVLAGKASVIAMDSKGEFIDEIKKLKAPLVLIEPDMGVALNPLDIGHSVALMEYLFSGLLEAQMTPLQRTLFRSVLTAMMAIPNATIETLRDLITNGLEPYQQYIDTLEKDDRDFFAKEFDTKTYAETRHQIVWRLRLLMSNKYLKAMFLAPRTLLDIGAEMDAGKIIVINNSKALLGDDGAEFFGRLFIALVLAAAQQRALRTHKMPVYFYIDECQTVIKRDEKIATIIQECRSQKIAMIFAHQELQQIKLEDVKGALGNCAIRFANSDEEAPQLAPRLRTTPEFLNQPRGTFAAFVRDTTARAVAIKVPLPPELDKMSRAERTEMLQHLRAKYCIPGDRANERPQSDYKLPLTPERNPDSDSDPKPWAPRGKL
jgi:hypothetical protein